MICRSLSPSIRFSSSDAGSSLGEIALDAVSFTSAEGGIGEHAIDAVGFAVAGVGAGEGVVVVDEAGVFDAVEEHVGSAEHVGQLLFLDCVEAGLEVGFVLCEIDVVLAHMADGGG